MMMIITLFKQENNKNWQVIDNDGLIYICQSFNDVVDKIKDIGKKY